MAADRSALRVAPPATVGGVLGDVKVSVKVTMAWKVLVVCSKLRLPEATAAAAGAAATEEGEEEVWVMLMVTGFGESHVEIANERPEATLLSSSGSRVASEICWTTAVKRTNGRLLAAGGVVCTGTTCCRTRAHMIAWHGNAGDVQLDNTTYPNSGMNCTKLSQVCVGQRLQSVGMITF